MLRTVLAFSALLSAGSAFCADQPSVHVALANFQGSGHLQEQTKKAVIRDYLQSWQSFDAALEQSRPDLLDRDFVGSAKEKLTNTIQEQSALGIHTRYRDCSHDLEVLFYSPDGLSIELADKVEYDVQVLANGKSATSQRIQARYIVVLTPAELRWRVRVLQAQAE